MGRGGELDMNGGSSKKNLRSSTVKSAMMMISSWQKGLARPISVLSSCVHRHSREMGKSSCKEDKERPHTQFERPFSDIYFIWSFPTVAHTDTHRSLATFFSQSSFFRQTTKQMAKWEIFDRRTCWTKDFFYLFPSSTHTQRENI